MALGLVNDELWEDHLGKASKRRTAVSSSKINEKIRIPVGAFTDEGHNVFTSADKPRTYSSSRRS